MKATPKSAFNLPPKQPLSERGSAQAGMGGRAWPALRWAGSYPKGEMENRVTSVFMPLIQKHCGFPLHIGRAGLLTVRYSEPHLPRCSVLCGNQLAKL